MCRKTVRHTSRVNFYAELRKFAWVSVFTSGLIIFIELIYGEINDLATGYQKKY